MPSFINFFLLFIFTTTIKAQERNFPFIRGIVIAAVSCNALAKTGTCLYGLQVERWLYPVRSQWNKVLFLKSALSLLGMHTGARFNEFQCVLVPCSCLLFCLVFTAYP